MFILLVAIPPHYRDEGNKLDDKPTVVPLRTTSTPVVLPTRPLNQLPSEEYMLALRRVSFKCFDGDFEKFLTAKTAQERCEIEAYLKKDGPNVDWTYIDIAMHGWALIMLGEDGSEARPQVVNL